MKEYYDRRADEYDDWYLRTGLFSEREAPGFSEELEQLVRVLGALPPARTLDVACGTGFLTRRLRGDVTGLDQSGRMLAIARDRVRAAIFVQGDGTALDFPDRSFERVFTAHFYGHLEERDRIRFLGEARRVADELVVVDAARAQSDVGEEWQSRVLNDGSHWRVYKRFFTTEGLRSELGGGEILHAGRWFVAVRSAA